MTRLHTEDDVSLAGRARQLFAAEQRPENRPDQAAAVAAQQALEERLHRLPDIARTAVWMLTERQVPPVPLDGIAPAGPPLETTDAILGHWTTHHDHGVGLTTGPHPLRLWTYLAVQVDTFAAWREWVSDLATYTVTYPDYGGFVAGYGDLQEVGPPIERQRVRDPGMCTRIRRTAPPNPKMRLTWMPARNTADLRGGADLGGWVLLAVPDADRKITVKRDRKLATGLKLLKSGTVVPWDGTRDDGGTVRVTACTATRGGLEPGYFPPADWLVDALVRR